MRVRIAAIQLNTKTSTTLARPLPSPHSRVTNKTAKPTMEVSASVPSTNPAPLKTTKLAVADVVSQTVTSSKASNKQAVLIDLMERPEGVSLDEMMDLSGWQAHSVRGWISGTLRKKLGLVVTRFKSASGETCYRIQAKHIGSAGL